MSSDTTKILAWTAIVWLVIGVVMNLITGEGSSAVILAPLYLYGFVHIWLVEYNLSFVSVILIMTLLIVSMYFVLKNRKKSIDESKFKLAGSVVFMLIFLGFLSLVWFLLTWMS